MARIMAQAAAGIAWRRAGGVSAAKQRLALIKQQTHGVGVILKNIN